MLAFVVTQYPAAIKQKAFYARWQCVDQAARRATNSNFRVSAPESIENVFFLTAEPNSWPNLWAARYYGLGSIASTSDPVAVCFVILGS